MMKLWPGLLLLALAALPACGGDDVPEAPDASLFDAGPPDASAACLQATQHSDFTWIQDNVFAKSCTGMSCHDADKPTAMLNLTAGTAHGQLVDVASVEIPAMKRIAPGNCDASLLYKKIINDQATIAQGDCTTLVMGGQCKPMPTVGGNFQPLCQEKIDAICRWIMAGAPMN